MAEAMTEIELLRAENVLLKQQLAHTQQNTDLFMILLVFLVMNVVVALIALRQDLLRVWREYEYLLKPPTNEPRAKALWLHDWFNLLVLPGVVLLDVKFIAGGRMDQEDNAAFWVFLWYTVAYIAIDMLWVALVPICVKSPTTILLHHAVTLLYMAIPTFNSVTRYGMAVCLTVEFNTWLLILRRQPMKSYVVRKIIAILFYITWFVIRCAVYPYLIYEFYGLYKDHMQILKASDDDAYYRASFGLTYMFIPPVFQILLCGLNLHWTIQLIRQKVRGKGPEKGL